MMERERKMLLTNLSLYIIVIFSLFSVIYSIPERPLLLVPGYTGSILNARNTTDNSTFLVFPTHPLQKFDYLYCKCQSEQDVNNKRCDSIYDDIEIYVPTDRYGLYAIDILNEDREYYHSLINLLVNDEGYEEGVTLFGFPYDWRQSFEDISLELEKTVNNIILQTNSPKIDILSHSMGCVLTKKYLSDSSDEGSNTHPKIEKYVSVAGPYGGIGASWIIISLFGTVVAEIPALPWDIHQLSMQFPSTYDFIAISTLYASYAASIKTEENGIVIPTFAYEVDGEDVFMVADDSVIDIVVNANAHNTVILPTSTTPCSIPFRTDYYNAAKESWQRVTDHTQQPNEYFEVYGISSLTPFSWKIPVNIVDEGNSTDYTPLLSNGHFFGANYFPESIGCTEGDQIITIQSVKNSKFTPTYSAYLPLDHVGLINDESSFPIYQQFLNAACSWEGYWEMNLLAINESNLYPPGSSFVSCPDLHFSEGEVRCDGEVCGTFNGQNTIASLKVYYTNWIAYTAQDELSSSDSTIEKMEGRFWGNQWAGRMILTNGEVLQYNFQMNLVDNCQSFTGWYANDWNLDFKQQVQAFRVQPDSDACDTGDTRPCTLANGIGTELCIEGFWKPCSACKTGFEYDKGFPYSYPSCVQVSFPSASPSPASPSPSPAPETGFSISTLTSGYSSDYSSTSSFSFFSSIFSSSSNFSSISSESTVDQTNTVEENTASCYEVPWYVFVICVIVAFIIGIVVAIGLAALFIFLKPRLMSMRNNTAEPTPNVEMNEVNDNIF